MSDFAAGAALGLLLTAALAAVLRVFPRTWRVPPGRFFLLGVLLALALGVTSTTLGRGTTAFVATAALLGSSPILLARARRARRIEAAIAGLADEGTRAESHRALEALIGPPPSASRDYRKWAAKVHHVAVGAARAGLPADAQRWAEKTEVVRLTDAALVARAQILAACAIALRDRARARRELAVVRRPAREAKWERALVALEVLLEALEGDPDVAEAAARVRLAEETEPALRVTWQMAVAHALAAAGRRDDARDALKALASLDGRALERVARHAGPASPVAEALLAESGAPYR